jgi:hypothetical protein
MSEILYSGMINGMHVEVCLTSFSSFNLTNIPFSLRGVFVLCMAFLKRVCIGLILSTFQLEKCLMGFHETCMDDVSLEAIVHTFFVSSNSNMMDSLRCEVGVALVLLNIGS